MSFKSIFILNLIKRGKYYCFEALQAIVVDFCRSLLQIAASFYRDSCVGVCVHVFSFSM